MTKFNATLTAEKSANDENIKNELLGIVSKAYGFKLKEKKNEEIKKGSFFIITEKKEEEVLKLVKEIEGIKDIKLKIVNDVIKVKKTTEITE